MTIQDIEERIAAQVKHASTCLEHANGATFENAASLCSKAAAAYWKADQLSTLRFCLVREEAMGMRDVNGNRVGTAQATDEGEE